MSGHSFRSIVMVASCAAAALGCYLVNLRVASERAALVDVETKIVLAQRDIRLLQTEIGTRGRLAQLERWNVRVLALSAPTADQFLEGGFALARLARPQDPAPISAPVVLASAPAQAAMPLEEGERSEDGAGATPAQLLRHASLKLPAGPAERAEAPAARRPAEPKAASPAAKPAGRPAAPATAAPRPVELAQATKKAGDKPAATRSRPVTSRPVTAKVDPLAPLPAGGQRVPTSKDSGPAR